MPTLSGYLFTHPRQETLHSCEEILDFKTPYLANISHHPLPKASHNWFIDGGSSQDGKRVAGYAVVSLKEGIESNPLPREATAPKAEFIALPRALVLVAGQEANIYTDSKYGYHILRSHAEIWEERGSSPRRAPAYLMPP